MLAVNRINRIFFFFFLFFFIENDLERQLLRNTGSESTPRYDQFSSIFVRDIIIYNVK